MGANFKLGPIGLALAIAACPTPAQAQMRVPACTAYLEPDPLGAEVSAESGITGWQNRALRVLWFGFFTNAGPLDCSLDLRQPPQAKTRLRLTLAGTSRDLVVRGPAGELATARFGAFNIAAPGYQSLVLESLNDENQAVGNPQTLVLEGPAALGARFNLEPRRNAASVHLVYPAPGLTNIQAFYCEVTALEDPLWTFYMACGWHRGYFGMQVNSLTERRIIFSVWDSGKEAVDRAKVDASLRVTLIAKGEGVTAGDFGNEGTGGHSHLVYPWKSGAKQRFMVTAKPSDATHTVYSGFYFHPEKKQWILISSWKAPGEGGYLRGLHSFSENFGGANGQLQRKALYGNQWIHTSAGQWRELVLATFSHDPTGRADRLDRFMGVEVGQFFLSNGGFVPGFTRFGQEFSRPAAGNPPSDFPLTALRE